MEIKNVIICGLGALGITYANKLKDICNLKVLANKERIEQYIKNTPVLNGKKIYLDYIEPNEKWDTDLIIIATKSNGLNSAIKYIQNFVSEKTIIISLINGISSEEKILHSYPEAQVLRSYFIGHSAMFEIIDNKKIFYQDGIGKIVVEKNSTIEKFFSKNCIDFETTQNIAHSQWIKLGVNIVLNQLTAINRCTVGELRALANYQTLALNLLQEVKKVAIAKGIENIDNYENEVLDSASLIADNGKTSMFQDIIANKKTEVEIFSGEIIRLGKIYNIKTPYNEEVYNKIKTMERNF